MSVLARTFALDLRSLALFRVGLAVVLLLDLATRAYGARAFLTDGGVFPRPLWFRFADPDLWSFHVATGTLAGQRVLLAAAALVAFALLVGWRTRTAAIVSLVLLVSLQNRNLAVFYGFDLLLRVSLLWACFLPLSARWSIDSLSAPPFSDKTAHLSAASAALTLQMIFVYVCSGLQKAQHETWRSLEGVWLGLTTDHHATALARVLVGHVELTRVLSALTLGLELFVPLLLLLPLAGRARDGARLFVFAAFVLFHVGTAALFTLGLFPLIGIVAWLPFLPAGVWDRTSGAGAIDVDRNRRSTALVGALFAIVVVVNIESVVGRPLLPAPLQRVTSWAGVDQTWNMFKQPMTDGWFIARATRVDGSVIDVLKGFSDATTGPTALRGGVASEKPLAKGGAPVTFEKPDSVSSTFASMRWRKYITGLMRTSGMRHRQPFLRWLCRTANTDAAAGERAVDMALMMVVETERPTQPATTTTRTLASMKCP